MDPNFFEHINKINEVTFEVLEMWSVFYEKIYKLDKLEKEEGKETTPYIIQIKYVIKFSFLPNQQNE